MNTQECCNHNCNQGRDCPLRKRNLAEEITEGFKALEAMRNNKPVAWMTAQGIQDVCTINEKEEMGNDFDDYIIPLYTHPAKTLTDEEIGQIWKDCMESPYMQINNPVGFARAILRKANNND